MKIRRTLTLVASLAVINFGALTHAQTPGRNGMGMRVLGTRAPDEERPVGQTLETRPKINPAQEPAFPGQTRAPAVRTAVPLDVQIVASGLSRPWGLAFLPEGSILVTEKTGTMRVVTREGKVGAPLQNVPAVVNGGDAGLLDIALEPEFARNRLLWFTYVEPRPEGNGLTVARARLSHDSSALEDLKVILLAPAYRNNAHYGSRLLFSPDRKLFVTLGERMNDDLRMQAQHLDSVLGKILRLNLDGSAPADNPFVALAGARPEIWTYGNRNPQGLAWNPETKTLWETEHGPQAGDEVNIILPGANYGWPIIAYGTEYTGRLINGGKTQQEGMQQPAYYWDPTIAPSGATFYFGDLVPEWRGNLFVAALAGEHLARLVLKDDRVVGEERLLQNQHQRIRHVQQGPDGALWVLTDDSDGRLIRLAGKR